MSAPHTGRPAAVVVDIEGTVGSIRFVKDVLFPYARARLRDYVRAHHAEPAVARQLQAVAAESGLPADDVEALAGQLERWSDEDRKVTPLKALQGLIWEGGYRSGELVAHLYPDAIAALRRWAAAGLPAYVYSSGSIAAQRLYFRHTEAGDLTPLLHGYFDTTTGPKQSAYAYRAIAQAIGAPAAGLAFLSDVRAELAAAREAGWQAIQVRRAPDPVDPCEPWIATFDQLDF